MRMGCSCPPVGDSGLDLGDGSVREKEMDLRAIRKTELVEFHDLLDVRDEEE